MMQEPQPYRRKSPQLSNNEQRIADAVVAALKPTLESIDKRLDSLERDVRGINQILAANRLIIDDPDD